CKIVQSGLLGVARASRVLVSASRRNNLFLTQRSREVVARKKSPRSRDALASTRDGFATRLRLLRYSRSRTRFVTRRKRRRLLRRVKRRWSQSSSQRRVSIFHWINRPPR